MTSIGGMLVAEMCHNIKPERDGDRVFCCNASSIAHIPKRHACQSKIETQGLQNLVVVHHRRRGHTGG